MSACEVRRTTGPVPLIGEVEGTVWATARPVEIDRFPWYAGGERQPARVRLLYDAATLFLQFHCRDRHVFAEITELNGPVCEDSCVEFFASPHAVVRDNTPRPTPYFNLEINCCGTMLMGYGPDRHTRVRIPRQLARRIEIATSEPGPTREESPGDEGWWVAVALPFDVVAELAASSGMDVPGPPGLLPEAGTVWRGNFYRCGGRTDPQYACWAPVSAPRPDYHRPESFGEIRFL